MSKEPKWKLQELPIAELVFLESLKVREPDKGLVKDYAGSYANGDGDKFPPIKAANIKGALCIVDGWHRTLAAQRAGLVTLPVLTAKMTEDQAMAIAAMANTKHGRGVIGKAEKERVIEMYFQDRANWHRSVRKIAADLPGIMTKSAAQRYLKDLNGGEEPPRSDWDAEHIAQRKQERLEQDAKAAIKTLETHWKRLHSPQTQRAILQAAEEALGRLRGDASKLPPNLLDI